MGLFKQMKDMKTMVDAAPGLIQQSQAMAAQAQAYQAQAVQAAQFQAAQAAAVPAAIDPAALAPINGVDLPTYAWVSKRVADAGYDQSVAPGFAAQRGIAAADWTAAVDGWATRMQAVPALGREFRRHFDAA